MTWCGAWSRFEANPKLLVWSLLSDVYHAFGWQYDVIPFSPDRSMDSNTRSIE